MTNSSKVFLAFLIFAIGFGYYGFQQWNAGNDQPVALATAPVTIEIPAGASAREVGRILEDNGAISSANAFLLGAQADGRAGQIQVGQFTIPPQATTEQILDIITVVEVVEAFTVTIPEGLTVEQTLQRIADAEGSPFTVEDLRAGLAMVALPAWVPPDRELPEGAEAFEGLLWPDTYEFRADAAAEEVLTRLIQQADMVVTEVGAATRNELSAYETLVLGSLVERETRVAEEREIVSSVIHNRLDIGQALQIDATVVYGIEVATGERPDRLINEDYQFQSPWSTYVNPGLPPTPISGVGRASLEAAAAPAETGFFYYVVDNPEVGTHRFSETLEQHNQAIAEIRGG